MERGVQEEIMAFNSIKHIAIEANPGRAHDATYSAKAIYGMGMILINPDLFSEMNDFRQRNKIAHEFYHIMKASSEALMDNYRPAGSDPEDDADKFAIEIFGKESI